jgi:hypothetical protein
VGGLLISCLQPVQGLAAGYGKLAGVVSDNKGTPLMGATVMILGPTAIASEMASQTVERVITDGHGRFSVEHLVPGWYSLKVSAPTRLPAMRNGIRVDADETAIARFVLTEIFAPVRFQVPNSSVSSWGDDWKWVLRTSSTTRPILRYVDQRQATNTSPTDPKAQSLPTEYMFGVLPGSLRRDPLADDPGFDSVLACLRSVSADSDLLVASSFAPSSDDSSTITTVFRRNLAKGQPQEIGLILHQFSLAEDQPGSGQALVSRAEGMVLTYSETRLLAPKVMVTAGMDVDYLGGLGEVVTAQPNMKLEYQAAPSTVVSAQFGPARAEGADSLLERIGMMDAFPRLTEHDYQLKMEQFNHSEATLNHRMGKSARVQVAAYHDGVRNAAVWGLGQPAGSSWLAGNFISNPAFNGIAVNAGNYQSAGFRAVYSKTFGDHFEALAAYSTGNALAARNAIAPGRQGFLSPQPTSSMAGKISAEIPVTHTRIVTSYEKVQNDRVTLVDAYGQAMLQVQPYLGVQIRQPLPTFAFLPAHIEALADFRNITGQGYVPVGQAGERPVILTSGYRCIRGGFSVQF